MQDDVPTGQTAITPPRRKRRWWRYGLIGLATLLVLAGGAFLSLAAYYHSLIKAYTAHEPLNLACENVTAADREALIKNWQHFYENVVSGHPTPPFRLSARDLQTVVAGFTNLLNRIRFSLVAGNIEAEFSVPLGHGRKPELQGRYLNGSAVLELGMDPDGFPNLKVLSLEANSRAAPAWLTSRVKRKNLLEDLHRSLYVVELLSGIEDITVIDDHLVITPRNTRPVLPPRILN